MVSVTYESAFQVFLMRGPDFIPDKFLAHSLLVEEQFEIISWENDVIFP